MTRTPAQESRPSARKPIPRTPKSRGIKIPRGSLFRIAMFAILLVGVLALRKPCSEGIGEFIESFDETDAAPKRPAPGDAGPTHPFVRITGDMSDEEMMAKLRSAGVLIPEDAGPDANAQDAAPGKTVAPASDTNARE